MVKYTADTSGAFTAATAGTDYQAPLTLTTTGTSGAATLIANTLNIPQYTGGGGGSPGGANTNIQYNDSSAFGGDANFTWDKTAKSHVVTSNSSAALAVGLNGATNPAFTIDASTASSASGLVLKSAATGGITTLTTTDSGSNAPLDIITKGTGGLRMLGGGVGGTGAVTINGGSLQFTNSGTAYFTVGSTARTLTFAPFAGAITTNTGHVIFTAPADTSLTAGANTRNFFIDNSTNARSHSTGALALTDDVAITGGTDNYVGASTQTIGDVLNIGSKNCGTNGTCTNLYGIYHATRAITGTAGNSAVIHVEADSGATTNNAIEAVGASQFAGAINPNIAQTTLSGTTSGNVVWSEPLQGSADKKFVAHAAAYVNNTVTNQTITYTTPFTVTPTIVTNDTGLTVTTTTTTLTITAPNNATAFSGNIIVEAY